MIEHKNCPDLVGITAFTSQANRAYEAATHFRRLGVPVVMGGIHATMCREEAMERVDAIVTGEAEGIWPQVLEDARHGCLKRRYEGGLAEISDVPVARHDLLDRGYACGAIQTTRTDLFKMLTYSHVCCAFSSACALLSNMIRGFETTSKKLDKSFKINLKRRYAHGNKTDLQRIGTKN
jgi:hypothetical protein